MNKFLNYKFLIRVGLGIIFIANALTAFFDPAGFVELIKNSFDALEHFGILFMPFALMLDNKFAKNE